jgi:hypothetical protein
MNESEFKKWLGDGKIIEEYYSALASYDKGIYRGFEVELPVKGKILTVLKDCNLYDVRAREKKNWESGVCNVYYEYEKPKLIKIGHQLEFYI